MSHILNSSEKIGEVPNKLSFFKDLRHVFWCRGPKNLILKFVFIRHNCRGQTKELWLLPCIQFCPFWTRFVECLIFLSLKIYIYQNYNMKSSTIQYLCNSLQGNCHPDIVKKYLIFILRMSRRATAILHLLFQSSIQQTSGTGRILKLLICFCLLLDWTNC